MGREGTGQEVACDGSVPVGQRGHLREGRTGQQPREEQKGPQPPQKTPSKSQAFARRVSSRAITGRGRGGPVAHCGQAPSVSATRGPERAAQMDPTRVHVCASSSRGTSRESRVAVRSLLDPRVAGSGCEQGTPREAPVRWASPSARAWPGAWPPAGPQGPRGPRIPTAPSHPREL